MATLTAPWDGRAQFPMATIAMANASLGRPLFDGVDPVGCGSNMYMLRNSWPPAPRSPSSGFSGAVAASQAPAEAPRSSPGARALWPNLT
jgi:hypothetical protein